MEYPTADLAVNRDDLEESWQRLLGEYQRFRNVHLSGVDSSVKSVMQILKEPLPKQHSSRQQSQSTPFARTVSQDSGSQMELGDYSEDDSQRQQTPGQPRPKAQLHLPAQMMDVGNLTVQLENHFQQNVALAESDRHGGQAVFATPGASAKRKKKKKDKHIKKKKRDRIRTLSDDDTDDDEPDEDDDDDEDMDPDYC